MEKFYREQYKNLTLEELQTKLKELEEENARNLAAYQANIKKSGATEEETKELNREERDLVRYGSRLEKEIAVVKTLIDEAVAKLQMQ